MRVLFLLLVVFSLEAAPKKVVASQESSLLSSLDKNSVADHLALHKLYPDTPEGKEALRRAWKLLGGEQTPLALPPVEIGQMISLVTNSGIKKEMHLTLPQIEAIEALSKNLAHTKLKGHRAKTRAEVLLLAPEEIDIARALLLFQFDDDELAPQKVRAYEATIDLMALQIRARLKPESSAAEKIEQINHFIFHEMGFRFPPHSLYAKNIDAYTFLSSVLDSRRGVCLGVSILYMACAQRLDLKLESITPPGHIFLRYKNGDDLINIETTSRGIHMDSSLYLGLGTRELQVRNLKEVVGMAFVNEASVAWQNKDYLQSVALYEKAQPFLENDPLLNLLLGINYLFIDKKSEGKKLLKAVCGKTFPGEVAPDTIAEDFLRGKVDVEGIKRSFLHVEGRDSILAKKMELEETLRRYPHFRMGLLQLSTCYLQLGRVREAQIPLQIYHKIDPTNPTVEYYLTLIALEQHDYNLAWKHLELTEKVTSKVDHHPAALKETHLTLLKLAPTH